MSKEYIFLKVPDWEVRIRTVKAVLRFFDKKEVAKELKKLGWTEKKVAYLLYQGLKNTKKRKERSIGLKLRFEIFKRDNYTCQYCGRKPPEVKLHLDHMKPLSKGGKSIKENLITSCEECNIGKGIGNV